MSDALQAAKLKAEKTYNAAADYFDAGPLSFWERYGRRTVEVLSSRARCASRSMSSMPWPARGERFAAARH